MPLVLLFAASCWTPPSREKTDVIHLKNGDKITGEIKELMQGKVRLKTTALDTVYVEWDKIREIASTYEFQFENTAGHRYFGRVGEVRDGSITIVGDDGTTKTLPLEDIVQLTQIDESFWSRLDGRVSLGANYTKSSDTGQLLFDMNLDYRARKARTELDLSTTITEDSDEERTGRSLLSLQHLRFRDRWFTWFLASLERNEALGLDLRSSLAAGGGNNVINTDRTQLGLGAGLAFSEEHSTDSSSSSEVVEGVLWMSYSAFLFAERDVDSDVELFIYPGITESGRVRSELTANVRREIFNDVFFLLSGYFSYDNEPPLGAEESDYGFDTGLGWSF